MAACDNGTRMHLNFVGRRSVYYLHIYIILYYYVIQLRNLLQRSFFEYFIQLPPSEYLFWILLRPSYHIGACSIIMYYCCGPCTAVRTEIYVYLRTFIMSSLVLHGNTYFWG